MPPKHLTNGFQSPVTAEEYHILMDDALRGKRLDEAWQVLELMQQDRVRADKYAVSRCLMKTLSDCRDHRKICRAISLVERFVQSQPSDADEVLFNSLLDACSRIQDVGRLELTLQRMTDYGVVPSAVTLGILVKAFGRVGDMDRVLEVWKSMHHKHIVANAVTYGCMIDACVKCGNLQMARGVFQDLKRMNKHRNTIIYTTLIKGFGAAKDLESVMNLFREMQDEGVPCNTITYNSVIDACVRCHDMQRAVEVFDGMVQKTQMNPKEKVEPDLITYSTMIKGYCHVGDLDRALDLSRQLDDRSLQADELVYNTLLDGCVRTNDLNTGVGLFEEMCTKQCSDKRLTPSAITFSILVRLYRRSGYQEEQAVSAVAHLFQAHGLPLREDTGVRDPSDTRLWRSRAWKGKGKGAMRKGKNSMMPLAPLTPAPDVNYEQDGPMGGKADHNRWGHQWIIQEQTQKETHPSLWSHQHTQAFPGNDPSLDPMAMNMTHTRGAPPWHADRYYGEFVPPPGPAPGHMAAAYPSFDERPNSEYMDWAPRTPEQYASYPGY